MDREIDRRGLHIASFHFCVCVCVCVCARARARACVRACVCHNLPVQPVTVPGGSDSEISRQSAHEGGKVVSPAHRPPFPLGKYSCYSFLLEAESTPGP